MKKTILFGVLALLIVGIVAAGAFAFSFDREERMNQFENQHFERGDFSEMKDKGGLRSHQAEMETKRVEMQTAMDQGYEAWLAVVDECPNSEDLQAKITAENFDVFVEMHKARQSGDFATANALAEELGLEDKIGFARENHQKGDCQRN